MITINSIKIATVYRNRFFERFSASDMSLVRWLRMSEAFAERGYSVDMIVNAKSGLQPRPNLQFVPYDRVDWSRYDVIKTLFHQGFDSLCEAAGDSHPFIISKLGSVVGSSDGTDGVHFFGREREELFATQHRINRTSRYITILTQQSRALWESEHGRSADLLLVPTGVDRDVPAPGKSPYGATNKKIAVYIGNLYEGFQRDINLLWQKRLNRLGRLLKAKNIALFFVGPGLTDILDSEVVTCLGPVDSRCIWDYQYFADVGIVLAQGEVQHNESSKIYYYLRTGLPVVSEAPVPNNHIIQEANLGFVANYADDRMIADMVEEAMLKPWDRDAAVHYILENHTWDKRVEIYDRLIKHELAAD